MTVRILVADDDPFVRRLIIFTLKKRGYTILEATDGDAALARIRQEKPDLAVLDVVMPGLTGIEVTRALAQDQTTAAIPVLLLSASAQAAEIQAGLASGAVSYLTKPFEPSALWERVEAILQRKIE